MSNNSNNKPVAIDEIPPDLQEMKVDKNDVTASSQLVVETSKVDKAEPSAKTTTKNEIGGPKGLEPTRYGDWESKGRCYDF